PPSPVSVCHISTGVLCVRTWNTINMHNLATVTTLLLGCSVFCAKASGPDNGMGEFYEWHSLEDGLTLSSETGKPVMLIIHKSWCGACKALKPQFSQSDKILELSKHFVMVNTVDDEEPNDTKYQPDGGYIPRILFLDSDGDVKEELINENGNEKYKYYYWNAETVVKSMKKAVKVFTKLKSSEEL
ncbi:unnamed protein product, partial [Meganyctiphanes norvegica]